MAGCATFFLAWAVHIVSGTGIATVPTFREAVFLFFVPICALGTIGFAGLVAWKDLSYGPIRLYLGGFLLPYIVWSLIVVMLGRDLPEFVQ